MTGNSSATERPTILLVEDEPSVRRSLQLVLQGGGYHVRSFATGAALLADPLSPKASAIVADYRLPDRDGVAILKLLRLQGFNGPAILVTAFNSPDLTASALKAGYTRVLEKPLGDRVLRDAVAALG